jgi:diguanylate cyclase (GGDEF)-like protein
MNIIRKLAPGIGRRIGFMVSLAVVVTVILISGSLAGYQAYDGARSKRSAVEGTAYVYASAVADYIEAKDAFKIRSVLRSVDRVPGVISASVYDATGSLIGSLGQRAILKSEMAGRDPGVWDMMSHGTVPVSVNIIKNGAVQGTLVLVTDISDLRARFLKTMIFVLAASLAAAGLGVFLSLPLQRRITRPIVDLTAAMREIKQSKDYSGALTTFGEGETAVMVESFNNLMADIRFRDISLQKLAYYDPLTGLPNRANFLKVLGERLERIQGGADSLSVSLLNIDAFHTYNDAFGHSIGDAILMNAAALIQTESGVQSFVARVGGDEFAVIVGDNGTGQQAEATLARIHAAFLKPLKFLGLELHITLGSGTAILPRDARNAADAMRYVDLASNVAKHLGPGRSQFFQPDMDDKVRRETELGQSLRQAIANNELMVHFQAQLQFETGRVTGFESLMRWKHPTLGHVSPAVFIPLAERTGVIGAMGDWILEESCRIGRKWMDAGHQPRSIAVNVSPAQILQAAFVRNVGLVLERTQFPPQLLCLELTESLFLGRSLQAVRRILDQLHQLGVTLALDDFGTGFSSLAYLSQLPFDKLKVDRSFVTAVQDSPRRLEILSSIINMAHSLGMDVVAEGAETPAEIEHLQKLGADHVQGFGISKPMAESDVLAETERVERMSHRAAFAARQAS